MFSEEILVIISVVHLYVIAAIYSAAELYTSIKDYIDGRDKQYYLSRVKNSLFYNEAGELRRRTALVTGAAGAIGRKVVKHLSDLGYQVFVMGHGVGNLRHLGVKDIDSCDIDLTDDLKVSDCLEHWSGSLKRLDLFVSCHGIMASPKHINGNNIERHMSVNFFSNVFMIERLSKIIENHHCRMVFLSSATLHAAHVWDPNEFATVEAFGYYRNGYHAYAMSKSCLTRYIYLKSREEQRSIGMISAHPGIVATPLYDNVNFLWRVFIQNFLNHILWSPDQAALKLIDIAHSSEFFPGCYYEMGNAGEIAADPQQNAQFMSSVEQVLRQKMK
ncbi:hypothetical protein QR680_003131 [Steinernema hermaphroditum]|uniref:Uncharacterized protein n=1 Tax=Steinernema hermaphroditum TaxID=289476 RepID=A0AA39LJK5_9BILA|nr:hypothetical protein QR680_003131 [Steinernema hermaphroditum]